MYIISVHVHMPDSFLIKLILGQRRATNWLFMYIHMPGSFCYDHSRHSKHTTFIKFWNVYKFITSFNQTSSLHTDPLQFSFIHNMQKLVCLVTCIYGHFKDPLVTVV